MFRSVQGQHVTQPFWSLLAVLAVAMLSGCLHPNESDSQAGAPPVEMPVFEGAWNFTVARSEPAAAHALIIETVPAESSSSHCSLHLNRSMELVHGEPQVLTVLMFGDVVVMSGGNNYGTPHLHFQGVFDTRNITDGKRGWVHHHSAVAFDADQPVRIITAASNIGTPPENPDDQSRSSERPTMQIEGTCDGPAHFNMRESPNPLFALLQHGANGTGAGLTAAGLPVVTGSFAGQLTCNCEGVSTMLLLAPTAGAQFVGHVVASGPDRSRSWETAGSSYPTVWDDLGAGQWEIDVDVAAARGDLWILGGGFAPIDVAPRNHHSEEP